MKVKNAGLILAGAAAILLASGPTLAAEHKHQASVKCGGANACKGKSACKSSSNACKGQNACKGKGWMSMKSKEECEKHGGKVME